MLYNPGPIVRNANVILPMAEDSHWRSVLSAGLLEAMHL